METYAIVMHTLSVFGILTIILSLYLLLSVPTKVNTLSRFAIHGHDIAAAVCQLYLTLGTTPTFIFPCIAGYPDGLFDRFNIMSPLNQAWTQALMFAITGWFSLLLSIIRVFALSIKTSSKLKSFILKTHFVFFFIQIILSMILGMSIEDGGEAGRELCKKKLNYNYPEIMYRKNSVNMIMSMGSGSVMATAAGGCLVLYFMTAGFTLTGILIQSIKKQGKSSQSSRFLANQQRLTHGIIRLTIFKFATILFPVGILGVCVVFDTGNAVVSQACFMCMTSYPAFSAYAVLMSNTDYINHMNKKLEIVWRPKKNEVIPST